MNASELMAVLGPRLSNTKLIVVANREPYIHVKRTAAPRRRGLLDWFRGRSEQTSLTWMRPGERAGHGARSRDAGVRRHVDRAWQRQRRPRGLRREGPGGGAARQPVLYAAPRLAHPGRGGRLLLRARQQRAVAALPHRLCAPGVRRRDWQQYQRVNQRFANTVIDEIGNERAIVFVQDYHFALLPRLVKEARPDVDRLPVLAHSVAQQRGVPDLSLERGDRGRAARQRPAGVPHPVPLQQLLRYGRRQHRGAHRPRALRRHPARPSDLREAIPDQHRPRAVVEAAQGAQPRSRCPPHAGAAGAGRGPAHLRCRSAGLHEGHSRAHQGLRADARLQPGVARPRYAAAGRRAQPRAPRSATSRSATMSTWR